MLYRKGKTFYSCERIVSSRWRFKGFPIFTPLPKLVYCSVALKFLARSLEPHNFCFWSLKTIENTSVVNVKFVSCWSKRSVKWNHVVLVFNKLECLSCFLGRSRKLKNVFHCMLWGGKGFIILIFFSFFNSGGHKGCSRDRVVTSKGKQ